MVSEDVGMTAGKSMDVSFRNFYQKKAERRIRLNRERRVRELRRKLVLCVAAAISGAFLAIVSNVFASTAEDDAAEPVYKYYKSYQIRQGDSLTSIAQEHIGCAEAAAAEIDVNSYIQEVIDMNHLSDGDCILAGNYIIIPYYSTVYME